MKIHCIRHEPYEGLAFIEEWINKKQYKLSYTYTYRNQSFPEEIDFDLLIIMGGTASVYNLSDCKWLSEEKNFLTRNIEKGTKILGICLGAQLIADVLGAKVYPAEQKEIGWFSVKFNPDVLTRLSFLPQEIITFHWHGDTFDIPSGTTNLASSDCTPNQGFIMGKQVVALQFHLEMNREGIDNILSGVSDMLKPEKFVQTESGIRNNISFIKQNNLLMEQFLEYLSTD